MQDNRRIVRLAQDHLLKPFDCGNADLNDFLLNDAKAYAITSGGMIHQNASKAIQSLIIGNHEKQTSHLDKTRLAWPSTAHAPRTHHEKQLRHHDGNHHRFSFQNGQPRRGISESLLLHSGNEGEGA